ncbi:MAG: hypothetical protein H7Y12_13795 [Sphingobacteriaceae bacterium]|nr:hypothetical protein [Cytophagaceae bacterium]
MKNESPLRLAFTGRYEVSDAQPILTEMVNAKLQHHSRKVARHATTEEDIKASEARIKSLEATLREIIHFLREIEQRGGRVDIEGTLRLREV